jgi:hypothetical protein
VTDQVSPETSAAALKQRGGGPGTAVIQLLQLSYCMLSPNRLTMAPSKGGCTLKIDKEHNAGDSNTFGRIAIIALWTAFAVFLCVFVAARIEMGENANTPETPSNVQPSASP